MFIDLGYLEAFFSTLSSGDHRILYQLQNKVNRTNVVKNPKNDFNACDDFFTMIVSCHVIAVALKVLKMTDIKDKPSNDAISNAEELWMQPMDQRKCIFEKICNQVVDSFVDFSFSQHGPGESTDKVNDFWAWAVFT